jgi:serine/threonine protein kinase
LAHFFSKANILVDGHGRACLADFGLVTIISDIVNSVTIASQNGGTIRWMSPELLDPDRLGLKESQPTERSDCYALGMVVLEVLSGQVPFPGDNDFVVMRKVMQGEHPERPGGAWFTDDLWGTLERCWSPHPDDRPKIEVVLEFLRQGSVAMTVNSILQRLVDRSFSGEEFPLLLESIFSSKQSINVIHCFRGDIQAVIDVLDEACHRASYFQGTSSLTPLPFPTRHWVTFRSRQIFEKSV